MKDKIDIYKYRRLGNLVADSIRFSFVNFLPLLKSFLLLVFPLFVTYFLLTFVVTFGFISEIIGLGSNSNGLVLESARLVNLVASVLLLIVGTLTGLSTYLIFTSFSLRYGENIDGKVTIREILQDARAHWLHFLGLGFIRSCVYTPFLLMFVWLDGMAVVKILFTLLFIYFWVSTSLADVIRMNESCGVLKALLRSFKLVNQRFWETFFMYFLLGLAHIVIILGLFIFLGLIISLLEIFGINNALTVFSSMLGAMLSLGVILFTTVAYAPLMGGIWAVSAFQYFGISQAPSRASDTFDLIDQIGKSDDPGALNEINEHF